MVSAGKEERQRLSKICKAKRSLKIVTAFLAPLSFLPPETISKEKADWCLFGQLVAVDGGAKKT